MANKGKQERFGFEEFTPFEVHAQNYWGEAGRTYLRLLREGVQASGDKQGAGIAQDLEVAPSQFSDALYGKNNRHFSALWVPRTIHADPKRRALEFLAATEGQKLIADRPFTFEEIAKRLLEAMLANPDVGKAILDKAFGGKADAVVRSTFSAEEDAA